VALVVAGELRDVLLKWQRGELRHVEIYEWTTERFGLEQMESGDPIVNEILGLLDIMDVNLTTPDDIPTFLRMLDEHSEVDALRILQFHGEHLDLDERMAKWKSDPFYGQFCHPVGRQP
jgi:hypothetical protein